MSSCYHQWTPDVFVSFQDNDNGVERFTSTLFAQLKRAGIGYISRIEELDQARFALVVFSANYANSSSRLDELVQILLRREDSKYPSLVVIPIFHGMDRAKVPELREIGEFKQALNRLHRNEKDKKKKEWRCALAKVEGISGYELNKDANGVELELIKTIVKCLVEEIRSLYSHKVFGPFGRSGKTPWHFDEIKGIGVVFTKFIESITFEAPNNTDYEPIIKKNAYKVKLEKGEEIISFSGYFDRPNDPRKIQALTFLTRKRELRVGPTGQGREADFSLQLPPGAGKVIEFFGSKSQEGFVTSIGARVELTRVKLPRNVSCPVGLFGSRRGVKWDAKQDTSIKGIRALCDSSGNGCIRSIAFRFGNDKWWWPPGSDEKWHMQFIINDPDEYLSSISGYYTCDGITSLTFLTNKKSTISIGDGKGNNFSSPATGYKIVGFYGWRDKYFLCGIGAYFKRIPNLRQVKSIGPFGGEIAWDDGKFKGVKKIYLAPKDGIRYIKIVYDDDSEDGHTVIHGDYTSGFFDYEQEVDLNCREKYLTSISGYKQEDGCIGSLTFHSNRNIKTVGPTEGEYFWYPSNKSKIIGFYGTCGKTLYSIGVYEELIPNWEPFKHKPDGFPGSGGQDWDDKEHSDVVGYRVTTMGPSKEELKIESITFMYENNGSLVEGSRHGGGDPSSGEWVMLNYPKERLLRIKGYWLKEDNGTIIHDLTIYTTDTNLPYAVRGEPGSNSASKSKPKSKEFTIVEKTNEGRRIVGFFGKAKTCINFIGAHLEP